MAARRSSSQTVADVDLDGLFRKQSKARVVAERLLTGRPQSRAELVEGLDLSLTTVPRVVEALEAAGVKVERTTDRTRQAIFRVLNTPVSAVEDASAGHVVARFVHGGGESIPVSIAKVEVLDSSVWVEFSWPDVGGYRARLIDSGDGAVNLPKSLLGGSAEIVALTLSSKGKLGMRLGDAAGSALVSDIRPTTAPPLLGD